jgi:hypothetical protein
MDSLKLHLGLPCPTLLRPAGGPPLKWPYGYFRGGPFAEQATHQNKDQDGCPVIPPLTGQHDEFHCS